MKSAIKKSMYLLTALLAVGGMHNNIQSKRLPDDTETIIVVRGEQFTVTLPSNPTTGYSWSAEVGDDGVVALEKSEYVSDPNPQGLKGVGGQEIFYFSANKPGTGIVKFEYKRPWETNVSPAEIKYFMVNVLDDDISNGDISDD